MGFNQIFKLLIINHYLKKELSDYTTDPEKIVYITFSRAAAEEASERIAELFPNANSLFSCLIKDSILASPTLLLPMLKTLLL